MKLYDVSQLPVLEGDHVVGLIDEFDLLLAVFEKGVRFHDPVRDAMASNIETIEASEPIRALLPIFERAMSPSSSTGRISSASSPASIC